MSATLAQIFVLNPTATIGDNDLLYLVQSPYTPGTDAGIKGSSLKALFVLSTAVQDVPHGGTGSTSFTPHSVIIAGTNPTDPLTNVLGTGTLGQVLTSLGPFNPPFWANNPASGTVNPGLINELAYYAAAGTTLSGLPTANRGVLATNSTGVPSINTTLLPFIVGPGGFYTTIQSAITAAAVGATSTNHHVVLINSGSYTENLALSSFVDLASFGGIAKDSVIVIGNAIYNPINDNESFSASGISFKTTGGGAAFSVNGVKICEVDLNECELNGAGGTAFENTNTNATITKSNCHLFAASGQKIANITAGSVISIGCKAQAIDTASTISGTANVVISAAFDNNAFILSNTSQLSFVNSVAITPSTLEFLNIGPTAVGIVFSNTIVCNSASGFWATGTGTIATNAITTLNGTAQAVNPTLTLLGEPLEVGNLSFDGGNTFIASDGQLIIGKTGGSPVINTLSSGSGITITPGPGTISIAASSGAGSPLTTKGDIYAFSTINDRFPVVVGDGKVLQVSSGATFGIAYSTPTYPSSSGSAGKILRSDATNNVYSTATFADTYSASNLLYSNGANTVTGLATATNGLLVTSSLGVPSILAGPGTTGNILQSNAAAAPSFSTATFPSTAGTSGNVIISNGTNYISSTSLWPNTVGTSGKVVISDGTSNVYSTPTFPNASATAGKIIRSDGTNWLASTSTFADTYAINTILYNASANTVSGLATANTSVLLTNGSGVPAWASQIVAANLLPLGGSGVSFIGSTTYNLATASGTQAITGVGFQPSLVLIMSGLAASGNPASIGVDNTTARMCLSSNNGSSAGAWDVLTTSSIALVTATGSFQVGSITAFGADGFTITWTKTGTPTGTVNVCYLCFK